jgi:cold shock CspA family protein
VYKGILKKWNDHKGFGFIQTEASDKSIFIHISTLKQMSRKPKVGDFIYFDIEKQRDGKSRAVNCRIEGVLAKKTNTNPRVNRRKLKTKSKKLPFIIMIIIVAVVIQREFSLKPTSESRQLIQPVEFSPKVQTAPVKSKFKCDGREYCSQMSSRAEAEFFTRNCPNTKMDGDIDGTPCENDSRF